MDEGLTWRIVYRVDPDAIVIAEVFAKKTAQTLRRSWRPAGDGSRNTTMRRNRRQRLAYVEMRLRLADSLRRRRQKRNLSQSDVAKLLHSSQSRVAKMEGGDPSVSIDLLIRSLLALGASNRDLARTISGAALPKAS
jgi:predicted XRE-type DNA-binding protein